MATKPKLGPRAARVQGVLPATLEELARVGYRALSVEEIAARAHVNKTTIYRHWPTKVDLVQAAFFSMAPARGEAIDTGTLRGDLVAVGRAFVHTVTSILGQGLFRVIAHESSVPELQPLAARLRATQLSRFRDVIERGIARGEVPASERTELLVPTLTAALHNRIFLGNAPVDEVFIAGVVDLLLLGAVERTPKRRIDRRGRLPR